MTQRPAWACLTCVHLVRDDERRERFCKAFPDEIPLAIWSGENDHTRPFEGDNGIQYERITEEGLTAAADVHDGAMIALIPAGEQLDEIAVDPAFDGEPEDQIHLTLFYLGDAIDVDAVTRQQIIDLVTIIAARQVAVTAQAFGAGVFNPDGDEPCLTLLLSGDELAELREGMEEGLEAIGVDLSMQHEPWIPHITLMYTGEPWRYVDLAAARTGDVTFDRIRVAFGGEVTDVELQDALTAHLSGQHDQSTHGHGHIMMHDAAMQFYEDANLTHAQQVAVYDYTTDSFGPINAGLRGEGPISPAHQTTIDDLSAAMRPLPQEATFARHMSSSDFHAYSGDRALKQEELSRMVGQTITHEGFTSTSLHESDISHLERDVQVKIYAPPGTRAVYAEPLSAHKGEREMILDRGTSFKVIDVTPNGDCCVIMTWEVQ